MKPTRALATVFAAALLASAPAMAGHRGHDYAKVMEVRPVSEYVQVSHPQRECWSEPVRYVHGDSNSLAGMVLGGVVGGVVGNRFGGGNGKTAMTAAGTLIGAAVGNNLARERGHGFTAMEERCKTVRVSHTEKRIVGYDVRYRYNGRDYWTRTDHHPGKRLPVRVDVTPAY